MILVTGANGRLGREIVKGMPGVLAPTQTELDIENSEMVESFFQRHRDVRGIVHSAALTSTDWCERDPNKAFRTNTYGTFNLSYWSTKFLPKCRFLFVSTCVFDGQQGNYLENHRPSPINVYQATKVAAEGIILSMLQDSVVVRTNFVARDKWPYPSAFADRFANYLFVDQVAMAVKEIFNSDLIGILHIAGTKKMSMYEAARLVSPGVSKCSMNDYTGPDLPRDMSVASSRWKTYDMQCV